MGESYMSGSEFQVSQAKELELGKLLAGLSGKTCRWVLRTGQHALMVSLKLHVTGVARHESRVEEGHLTLDEVFFTVDNQEGVGLTLSVDQFLSGEEKGNRRFLYFNGYQWMLELKEG